MAKQNCWEYKNCGRETGGREVDSAGICPAATELKTDRLNNGLNGGRACWAVKNTLCDDTVQKVFAIKLAKCLKCDFYRMVSDEEPDGNYCDTKMLLRKLG